MHNFCCLSFLFLKGNGLRNSISFGEPKLYVIQLRLGFCVLRMQMKRKENKNKKKQNNKSNKAKKEDIQPNCSRA